MVIHQAQEHLGFFEGGQGTGIDLGKVWWFEWKGQRIPSLFGNPVEQLFSVADGRTTLHVDLVSNCFFFLSNWQERFEGNRDALGRLKYSQSIQAQLKITGLPVVDYYLDLLRHVLELHLGFPVAQRKWHDGTYVVFPSHDIDTCQSAWLQGGFRALKAGKLGVVAKLIGQRFFAKDAWFNFGEIIALERSLGAVSTFFFIARNSKRGGLPNADYDIRTKQFAPVLAQIRAAKSELGIHGSLGSHADQGLFADDLQRLPFKLKGNRFHFLGFDARLTPELLQSQGIDYDTSLGFAEHIGFRNGTCRPFLLWSHSTHSATSVLEIPLAVMDATLQFHHYMGLAPEQSMPAVKPLMQEIAKWNGVMALLWHNTHFSDHKYKGWREVYMAALEAGKQDDCVFMTGEAISEAWQSKGKQ